MSDYPEVPNEQPWSLYEAPIHNVPAGDRSDVTWRVRVHPSFIVDEGLTVSLGPGGVIEPDRYVVHVEGDEFVITIYDLRAQGSPVVSFEASGYSGIVYGLARVEGVGNVDTFRKIHFALAPCPYVRNGCTPITLVEGTPNPLRWQSDSPMVNWSAQAPGAGVACQINVIAGGSSSPFNSKIVVDNQGVAKWKAGVTGVGEATMTTKNSKNTIVGSVNVILK